MALMFLTGDGMSTGPLHHHIAGAPLIGERRTTPRYRLYSVRDEFPALGPVRAGGQPILGELYDVPMSRLWDLLAHEPPELEFSMVELADADALDALGQAGTGVADPGPLVSSAPHELLERGLAVAAHALAA